MVAAIAGRLRGMGLPTDADRRHPVAQHRREHSGHARRVARRNDRGAAAAAVAPRRRGRRAGAHRRQGADHLRPRRQLQSWPIRHARRGRRVFHPLRLRLRRQPARRRGAVRRSVRAPSSSIRCRRSTASGETMPPPMSPRSPSMSAKAASCRSRAIIAELLAGGLAVLLESAARRRTAASCRRIAPSSFAGICLTLLPWLLSGGTLVLHHPFDPGVLCAAARTERCGTLILPGPWRFRLPTTGAFASNAPPA